MSALRRLPTRLELRIDAVTELGGLLLLVAVSLMTAFGLLIYGRFIH